MASFSANSSCRCRVQRRVKFRDARLTGTLSASMVDVFGEDGVDEATLERRAEERNPALHNGRLYYTGNVEQAIAECRARNGFLIVFLKGACDRSLGLTKFCSRCPGNVMAKVDTCCGRETAPYMHFNPKSG